MCVCVCMCVFNKCTYKLTNTIDITQYYIFYKNTRMNVQLQ